MTSRYLLSKVEAVPGKDVLNPRDYSFGEGSLDGAFVIYRLRKAYPSMSYKRLFDKTRYELSKHLPQIIATLPNQFCYHGGYSRYCSCKIKQDNGIEIYYQVVYRVWKEHGKMRFHIESAYPLNEKLGRVKKVDFWVICHNLLHSKKLPKPSLK